MIRDCQHSRLHQHGAALVEFAIALPLILIAVAAVFDVVSLLRYTNIAIDASRFAGRMAGVSNNTVKDACDYVSTQLYPPNPMDPPDPSVVRKEMLMWNVVISDVTVCDGGFSFKQLEVRVRRDAEIGFHPFGYLAGIRVMGRSAFPSEISRPLDDYWTCSGSSISYADRPAVACAT